MRLPTVKVHHPDDPSQPMLVNECDFDPERYTPWGEAAPSVPSGPGVADVVAVSTRKLRAFLADVDDAELVIEAMRHDTRQSTEPIYAARLAELAEEGA